MWIVIYIFVTCENGTEIRRGHAKIFGENADEILLISMSRKLYISTVTITEAEF